MDIVQTLIDHVFGHIKAKQRSQPLQSKMFKMLFSSYNIFETSFGSEKMT